MPAVTGRTDTAAYISGACLLLLACDRTPTTAERDAGVLARVSVNDPVLSEVSIRWRARVLSSTTPTVPAGAACMFDGTSARTRSGRQPLWLRGVCGGSIVYEPFLEDLGGGPLDHGNHGRCQLTAVGDRYRLHCPPQRSPSRTVWSHWLEHRPGDIAVVVHQWLPTWTVRLHWEPLSDPVPLDAQTRP